MGRDRDRTLRAGAAGAIMALAIAGCGTVLPSQPTPPPPPGPPFVPAPTPGPVDLRLFGIDPFQVLRSVEGGAACRQGTLAGGHGSDGGFHALSDFTCPRLGNDRNVYFLFVDAYEAALRDAGVELPGRGSESGDASQPIATDWTVRGDARIGTARVIGENGPGTLRLFVSLDLLAP